MSNPLIVGFGEVLWDQLPTGRQCGGAPANVTYHCQALGAEARIISAVGKDAAGNALKEFLLLKKIDCRYLEDNQLPTGLVTVSLQNGVPSYEIHQPAAWDAITVPPQLQEECHSFSAFVFGSLAQRDERSRSSLQQILRTLPDTCLKIFDINLRQSFYTKERLESSLLSSNVLKLNDEELLVLEKLFALPHDQEKAVAALADRFSLQYVILTLGAQGCAVYPQNGHLRQYPIFPCSHIEDTVGCGDSFLAAWLVTILQGKSLEEAMTNASKISAFVAENKGAMPDYKDTFSF